jgi:sarcosine oxidase delta subunit
MLLDFNSSFLLDPVKCPYCGRDDKLGIVYVEKSLERIRRETDAGRFHFTGDGEHLEDADMEEGPNHEIYVHCRKCGVTYWAYLTEIRGSSEGDQT